MSFERQDNTIIRISTHGQTLLFNELPKSLPFSFNEYYRCRHCNYLIPKKEALISSYDSEHSLQHIHCTNCGRIVTWSPGTSKIRSVAEGFTNGNRRSNGISALSILKCLQPTS